MNTKETVLHFIDYIGSKLHINMRYFTAQGIVSIIGHIISISYGLVLMYLTAAMFSKEMYGQYQFVLSIVGTLSVLKLASMSTSISRDLNQAKSSPLWYTAKLYSLVALLFGIAILCVIPFLYFWNRMNLWPLFVVTAIIAPIEAIAMTFAGGIINGKALFKHALKYSLASKLIMLVLIVIMFTVWPSPLLLILITLGTQAVVYGVYAWKLLHRYSNNEESSHILSYGFKLSLASVPSIVVWYIDGLMISAYFGITQLAVFSAALIIPEQFKVICKDILVIALPKQAAGHDSWKRRHQLITWSLLGTIPFLIAIGLYWMFADTLFYYLLYKYYDPSTIFLSKIAFATLIVIPWNIIPQYLEVQGFYKETRNLNTISSVLFAVCLVILIPKFHLIGAIVSRGVFRLSGIVFSIWCLYTSPINHNTIK